MSLKILRSGISHEGRADEREDQVHGAEPNGGRTETGNIPTGDQGMSGILLDLDLDLDLYYISISFEELWDARRGRAARQLGWVGQGAGPAGQAGWHEGGGKSYWIRIWPGNGLGIGTPFSLIPFQLLLVFGLILSWLFICFNLIVCLVEVPAKEHIPPVTHPPILAIYITFTN